MNEDEAKLSAERVINAAKQHDEDEKQFTFERLDRQIKAIEERLDKVEEDARVALMRTNPYKGDRND